MVDTTRLEEGLAAADAAGDTAAAAIFASELRKAQASNAPKEGGVFTGMYKRGVQAAEGLKGTALRAGEAVGVVSPQDLRRYEESVNAERSVMSSEYGRYSPTGAQEIAGSTITDIIASIAGGGALKAGKAIPYVGGVSEAVGGALAPTTIPQAATGGALYSLTTPSASLEEAAIKAGTSAVGGGATQFGLRQVGLAPLPEARLTPQQQEVARRALAEGFQLDPTQITGYGGALKEGIKSKLPIAGEAFTRFETSNQAKVNDIAKQFIKLPANTPLTNESMQTAYKNALENYQVLKQVPAIQGDQVFVDRVNSALARFEGIPATQLSNVDKRTKRILNEYKDFGTNAISGNAAYVRSKKIGDDLFKAQKEGEGTSVEALKDLRRAFEDSIEGYLASPANQMRATGKQTLDQFREGRKTLSNWYIVDKAFNNETGNISASKLSKEFAKRPTYGTTKEPIETAAMLSGAFPKAFPSSGTTERASWGDIVKLATQAPVGIPAYIGTSAPVRNVLAQRYLGAKPEGIIGNVYGGAARVGGVIPEQARYGIGTALRNLEAQQQTQMLNPLYGLLGQ